MRSDVLREFEKLPARALMMATGLQRKDIEKPLIGIISSWTDLVPGHADMFSLERFIERGVAAAGGTPFIVRVPAICDGIAMGHEGMRFSLPLRELIADAVEDVVTAHQLDGIVLLTACDKITPGMLMGAARVVEERTLTPHSLKAFPTEIESLTPVKDPGPEETTTSSISSLFTPASFRAFSIWLKTTSACSFGLLHATDETTSPLTSTETLPSGRERSTPSLFMRSLLPLPVSVFLSRQRRVFQF